MQEQLDILGKITGKVTGKFEAPLPSGESTGRESKSTGKATDKMDTPLPGGESMGGFDTTKTEPPQATAPGEGKVESEEDKGETEGLPQFVEGPGIIVKAVLSLKTLVYYQMAATVERNHGGNLSLGDFLDDVTEDYFSGRGQSLGLVKLPEK